MTQIAGLQGLRPKSDVVAQLTVPPYDVIKPGTKLETMLRDNPRSLWHVTLGSTPLEALARLRKDDLVEDETPCFYVYEQTWTAAGQTHTRIGFFAAVAVTEYAAGEVIRHEKTFDDKVQGRLKLTRETGLTLEPVFLLTKASVTAVCKKVLATQPTLYEFTSDFGGESELHGIRNRFVRVPASTTDGQSLQKLVGEHPLYIADGHHRYHAALKGGQTHCMAYIVEEATIQAYNRVINGLKRFEEIKDQFVLERADSFVTPPRHAFCIYHRSGTWLLKAKDVPTDVVGSLDCSILEREFYPALGLTHAMIKDPKHFDYYPEQDLDKMREQVDAGTYDLAVALHPVSIDDLISVADAGLKDSNIVMPEKSTFFAPKILSGIVLYRHTYR